MDSIVSSLRFLAGQLAGTLEDTAGGVHLHEGVAPGDWDTVVELADYHALTPALWEALDDSPLKESIPDGIDVYLGQIHGLSRDRNQALLGQLEELIFGLNARGIEPVLLKGAGHLVTDVYPSTASRMMADLDILIGSAEVDRALDVLDELRYRARNHNPTGLDDHHHVAPRVREDRLAPVELHRGLIAREAAHLLPTEIAMRNTEAVALNGWSAYILSPTYRMIHNMLHSGVVNRYYEQSELDLNSLYEMHRMVRRYGNRIDWSEITATFTGHQIKGVLDGYLHALNKLFGSLPYGVRPGIGAHSFFLCALARLRWRGYDRLERRLSGLTQGPVRIRHGWFSTEGAAEADLKRVRFIAEG